MVRLLMVLPRSWTQGSLALLALIACLAVWSVGIEPRWVAELQIDVVLPNWHGPHLKIAVASDWHFTKRPLWRVMTVERAQALVAGINAAKPDLILLPGDLIADHDYQPTLASTAEDEIALVLGQLHAPLGVYAVLGNHDWWHNGDAFKQALGRQGIRVLENEAQALPLPILTPLWLVGIGDDFTGHSHPVQALKNVPPGATTVAMMHDPASLLELPSLNGFAVAGHTHGGQVSVPGYGALVVPGAAPRAWAYGWVEHQGNRLYVTSGLGVSILPVRFNQRPEWVMFSLQPASSALTEVTTVQSR